MHRRIAELDGLRGCAVALVLAWHFIGSMMDRAAGPAQELVYAATIFGRTGVDLFFVLSGFLIIGIIVDHRGAGNFFRTFYTKRAWRIYPPYLALIIAYWLCFLWVGESAGFNSNYGIGVQVFAQVTFLWNFLMSATQGPVARGFAVTWSVGIEEWFYLTFPLMLWLTPKRWIVPLLLVVGLGSAGLRAGAGLILPKDDLAPYILPFFRLDSLCFGGLLAVAYRTSWAMHWLGRNRWSLGILAVVFLMTLPVVIALCRGDISRQMYLWGHFYLATGYGIVLAAVLLNIGSRWLAPLRWAPLIGAGVVSYTLYLFHPLFISLYFEMAKRPELLTNWLDVWLIIAALITSIVFSVGFYFAVERRALSIGKKALYSTGAATSTIPASSPYF